MKQVTIDNVRERIAELEMVHSHGELSLRGEFELACLRMLADSMDVKPFMYGIADPDGAAHMDECCVSTSMAGIEDYVHMLNEECEEVGPRFKVVPLYTAPPVQVNSVDDDVRNVVVLLENNEWAEHCTKTELGQRLEIEITRLHNWLSAQLSPESVPEVVGCEDVPEEITEDDIALASAWAHGFNQCRAAMLNQAQEPATDNTAQQFEALATSAVHPRVSGWSERQQKVIAYSLWRFSCAAYQKANQAAQTNNKDMFDRFIRDARCAEEIREEFTSAWGGKL